MNSIKIFNESLSENERSLRGGSKVRIFHVPE